MGRAVKQTIASKDLEQYFKGRGMKARFWQDQADYMLHILVKPDIGQAESRLHFLRPHVSVEHSPWFDHWWARLLRRIHARWKILPYWLRELVWAERVHYSESLQSLPSDVLERIKVMRHYLMGRRINPTKVVIGAKAMMKLRTETMRGYGDYYPITFGEHGFSERIFDLEIQINPFLTEDAVIVC